MPEKRSWEFFEKTGKENRVVESKKKNKQQARAFDGYWR